MKNAIYIVCLSFLVSACVKTNTTSDRQAITPTGALADKEIAAINPNRQVNLDSLDKAKNESVFIARGRQWTGNSD